MSGNRAGRGSRRCRSGDRLWAPTQRSRGRAGLGLLPRPRRETQAVRVTANFSAHWNGTVGGGRWEGSLLVGQPPAGYVCGNAPPSGPEAGERTGQPFVTIRQLC